MDTKEEKVCISVDVVPFFGKHDYFGWRAKIKAFLKKYGVWEIVINTTAPYNKKSKAANRKEVKKNNTTTLKFFLDGLPSSIKESLGEFTSARELWLKLEGDYQGKVQGKQIEDEQEIEPDPIYGEIDKALAEDDAKLIKDLENAERELQDIIKSARKAYSVINSSTMIKFKIGELVKVKDQAVDSLQKHQQRTKDLKDLLKRLKDENTHLLAQLDEKDGEIDRLQEEVADDAHLKTQLEEAKRVREVLKDQLDEKEKAYQKLEMEVVEQMKKTKRSEAHVKTNSSILDEILESQRSPFDKTGIGYNKTIK